MNWTGVSLQVGSAFLLALTLSAPTCAGNPAARRRSAVRCTGWRRRICGARRAAGRKPASALLTDPALPLPANWTLPSSVFHWLSLKRLFLRRPRKGLFCKGWAAAGGRGEAQRRGWAAISGGSLAPSTAHGQQWNVFQAANRKTQKKGKKKRQKSMGKKKTKRYFGFRHTILRTFLSTNQEKKEKIQLIQKFEILFSCMGSFGKRRSKISHDFTQFSWSKSVSYFLLSFLRV